MLMWSSRSIVFTNLSARMSRPGGKSQVTALVKAYVCVNLSSCFCCSCSTLLIWIVYFSFCFLVYLVLFCVSWMSCEGNSSKCSQKVARVPDDPVNNPGAQLGGHSPRPFWPLPSRHSPRPLKAFAYLLHRHDHLLPSCHFIIIIIYCLAATFLYHLPQTGNNSQ